MKTTDEILELLRQFKSVAGEKYGIEQLALFGSAARGEQREDSDIDICVKFTQNHLPHLYGYQRRNLNIFFILR